MIDITFAELVSSALQLNWKLWVYIEVHEELTGGLRCIALDVDEAELASDGFTPLVVEQENMEELISMQDLQGVIKSLDKSQAGDINVIIKHVSYFVENDAYLE